MSYKQGFKPVLLAVVVIVLAAASLTIATGGGKTGSTPADASAAACKADRDACEFSIALAEWVGERGVQAIVSSWTTAGYRCPGPKPDGLGGPYPLCRGAR